MLIHDNYKYDVGVSELEKDGTITFPPIGLCLVFIQAPLLELV